MTTKLSLSSLSFELHSVLLCLHIDDLATVAACSRAMTATVRKVSRRTLKAMCERCGAATIASVDTLPATRARTHTRAYAR